MIEVTGRHFLPTCTSVRGTGRRAGRRAVGARYDAFISYSHTPRSTAIALGLQTGLERFARPWYRRRSARVFRDTTNLSVSPQLWEDIQRALEGSAWFVLLASPDAATSRWVDRELGWWLENRRAASILPVLVEGTLGWDTVAGRFDPTSTALPTRLHDAYTQEPLWLDLSGSRSANEPYSESAMEHAVASVAARLRGVDLDTVIGEHISIGRRTRQVVAATVFVLAAFAAAAGAGWVTASAQRDQANRAADIAASRNLVLESEGLRSGQIDRALRLGIAAVALDDSPGARANLVAALADSRYAGTLPDTSSVVHQVSFAPTGRLAVTVHLSGVARIWDLGHPAAAVAVSTITPGSGSLNAVAFRPDGRMLALGGRDGTVTLWDVTDPAHPVPGVRLPPLRTAVQAVAFDASGSRLYVGSNNLRDDTDDGVRVWDVHEPSRPVLSATIPTSSYVQRITILPGREIVAISGTSGVEMWSTDGRRPVGQITAHQDTVYGAASTPDGSLLVTCSGDRTVRVWSMADPAAPVQIARLPDLPSVALACDISRDGRSLAIGLGDGTIQTWDIETPARPVITARLPGHSDIVDTVAYSADGLLLSGAGDGRALVWSAAAPTRPVRTAVLDAGTGPVTKIGVGPNGVAAFNVQTSPSGTDVDVERTARLYRLPTAVADLRPASKGQQLWLSPNGQTLAVPGPPSGGVALWDVSDPARPARTATLDIAGLSAEEVAWSADGATMLVSGQLDHRDDSGGAATLWDLRDARKPVRLTTRGLGEQAISAAAIRADGRVVVTAGADNTVAAWDVADPRAPHILPGPVAAHPTVIRAMVFSPTTGTLVTASNDQTVALWAPTGHRLAVLQGPTDAISDVGFSADGALLATLDEGGGVTLWDVDDAELPVQVGVLSVDGGNRADAIAWSARGDVLYVGRFNGTVETWDLQGLRTVTADPRAAACALTGRGLDETEWATAAPERPYRSTC